MAVCLSLGDAAAQRFLHFRDSLSVVDLLISPLFGTLAILVAARDAGYFHEPFTGRFLDRAWAVIVLQFVISLLRLFSETTLASAGPGSVFLGTIVLTSVALLIYSPVDACLREEGAPLTLLPNALSQSIALSWRRVSRAFGMFAVILSVEMIEQLTFLTLVNRHVANPEFWANIPFDPFATMVISVIVTAAYIDLVRTKTPA
ncbi:MAG: hypothetical protein JO165_01790 [Candidatus Eremiobacteraeota bacterium]|nr:hypothetical protein [Candidatus Eremiobacteraeota bacterium]